MTIIYGKAQKSLIARKKRGRSQKKRCSSEPMSRGGLDNHVNPERYTQKTKSFSVDEVAGADTPGIFEEGDLNSMLSLDEFGSASPAKDQLDSSGALKETIELGNNGYSESEDEVFQDAAGIGSEPINAAELRTLKGLPIHTLHGEQNPVTEWDKIGENHTFEQGRASEIQQEDSSLLPAWKEPILDVYSLDFDYPHFVDTAFGGYSSIGSIPEASFEAAYRGSCGDQGKLLPDDWPTLEHWLGLTPDASSRSNSPCLSQHQYTTGEPMNSDGSLRGMSTINEIPSYSLGNSLEEYNERTANPPLNSELTIAHGAKPCDIINGRGSEAIKCRKQSTAAEAGSQVMPPTSFPRESLSIEDSDKKNRQLVANMQAANNQCSPSKRWWACPWYKRDPRKYQGCAKYKLQRIKDVKQHTYRKHMRPDIYCPVCFSVFTKASDRDGHIQKKSCDSRAEPIFDGISERQRKELNQNANRGRNDMEQWYNMWETIFPGDSHPSTPYLGNGLEESLPLFRNFWNKKRPEIISSVLQASQPKFEQIIQHAMDIILKQLEVESSSWGATYSQHMSDVSWENSEL
ncbi:hypothetical protein F4677DRAFT_424511 [Hypoxylon crocopeplum]|nr:hypothetical protein F4677DRAFT_424511 [Hypoxylon crocopeplum]